jgi:Zn-dependent protease
MSYCPPIMSSLEPESMASPPPATPGFDDAALESQYQHARTLFVSPPAVQNKLLLLIGSVALFVLATVSQGDSVARIAILVGVLFFHELGHYAGMVAFGYRDVKMFFIPFFGAAVSGKKGTVGQTREAIVLLLGPAPGIVLGLLLAVAAAATGALLLRKVAVYLVIVNGLNLLPVAPLDGGRLFSVLLFSRWRWAERLFLTAAALALVGYGFAYQALAIGILGVFVLVTLPIRGRMRRVAGELQPQFPSLVNDPAQLDDATMRALFTAVRAALPRNTRAKALASWMGQVLDDASQRPPSLGVSFAIFGCWAATLLVALVALVVLRS